MSHEITTRRINGQDVAYAAFEVPAWHQLGTVVGRPMHSMEALEFANMAGWDVRKVPLWADLRNDAAAGARYRSHGDQKHAIGVAEQYATVFTDPVSGLIKPISVVGERYEPIQWESVAEFGDAILDVAEDALIVSLGSLSDFKKGFISIKLPQTMVLEGKDGQLDVTEYYLTLFNSFDGSSTFFGLISTVRVVCANTARAAIKGAISKFSIRHTAGWKANVEEARSALKLSLNYSVAFEKIVRDQLFDVAMTTVEMRNFANELVGLNDVKTGGKAAIRRGNIADHLTGLFISSPTIAGTAIEGTRFAAYNAVTEYMDHKSTVRGGADLEGADLAALRAQRTILNMAADTQNDLKTDAWRLLTV
jgi:phage/plasmid-like protein (TIGR03299 family)